MTELSRADLEVLAQWDTPTICNGLELMDAKHRTSGFTTGSMVCFDPGLKPIVGYARTALILPLIPI